VLDLRGELDPAHFSACWTRYHERWGERNQRMERIERAARGEWSIRLPDDKPVEESHSPNLILTALEDTAEAASLIPSVRIKPSGTTDASKKVAGKMEKIGTSYLEGSEIELLTIRSLMNLSGFGMFAWVVTKKPGEPPRIQWRDPRTCFPEPTEGFLGVTNRCFFARDLYLTQLDPVWQEKFCSAVIGRGTNPNYFMDHAVTLIEYYDPDETIIAGVYDSNIVEGHNRLQPSEPPQWVSIILERTENESKQSPVVIGQRVTFDGEPRGQFDQVIGVMEAHIRLMRLTLDYADQSVYSDMWVKDVIGRVPMGGGSLITLGPNGEIGRVPPAVSSITVHQEMQQLVEGLHLGGRWPKTRPGDIDQSNISSKAMESAVGMLNTVIRTYHLLMRRALKQAQRVMFKMDHQSGEKRLMAGVFKNQSYQIDVDTKKDIDISADIDVTYGLGLGHDPSSSMVMGIQASQAGIVSLEFVQENFEGIEDVQLEKVRVDAQDFIGMMKAELLAGVQGGTVPKGALSKMLRGRLNGETIQDLFDKFVAKPEEEMRESMMMSGLTGGMVPPGPAPQQGGMVPPAPPPEELFAALGAAAVKRLSSRRRLPEPQCPPAQVGSLACRPRGESHGAHHCSRHRRDLVHRPVEGLARHRLSLILV